MGSLQIDGTSLLPKGQSQATKKLLKAVFETSGAADFDIVVSFVSDKDIAQLNKQFRGKENATDVLSFPVDPKLNMPGMEKMLGEMVISVDSALSQAQEFEHAFSEEVAALFAHGLLHLLGYDHERSFEEARLQAEAELSILDCAGINPDIALLGRNL